MEDVEQLKANAKKNSFWFSLAYVSLGLISTWALFSNNFDGNDFVYIVIGSMVLITLPVFLLSFPALYSGNTDILIISIIIVFLIIWLTSYWFLVKKYRRQQRLAKKAMSLIIFEIDYFPFGLSFNSYQRENSVEQQWKFQGQEQIDDLGLNWDSFKWRNHQLNIGRFLMLIRLQLDDEAPNSVSQRPPSANL